MSRRGKRSPRRNARPVTGWTAGVAPAIPHLAAQREALSARVLERIQGRKTHARRSAGHDEAYERGRLAQRRGVFCQPAARRECCRVQDIKHSSPYEKGKELGGRMCQVPRRRRQRKDPRHAHAGRPAAALSGRRDPGVSPGRSQDDHDEIDAARFEQTGPGKSRPVFRRANPGAARGADARRCGRRRAAQRDVRRLPRRARRQRDAATPSLAGQDAQYLAKATKSYRTTRQNWGMQRYVAGLSDKDIDNIAAFYASQQPKAAEQIPSSTQELAEKCNRCHDRTTIPRWRRRK